MIDIKKLVQEHRDLIIRIRRDLHQIPEPAFTEQKTSAYVAEHLKREKLEVKTGIAKTGVTGLLRSKKPGKTLMIRSDIDALPVQEETGLPFKSTHDGAMHAEYELNYSQGYPPTINNDFISDVVKGCAEETVGQKKVIEPEPTMGGEDMASFLEKSKGCYFFLGVGREGSVSLHNPNFDFNEDVLLKGVETYIRCALKLLG